MKKTMNRLLGSILFLSMVVAASAQNGWNWGDQIDVAKGERNAKILWRCDVVESLPAQSSTNGGRRGRGALTQERCGYEP